MNAATTATPQVSALRQVSRHRYGFDHRYTAATATTCG